MLHEIFKGMDNSAEQINENFQNGSIVESGVNENGEYLKFGNGWMICTFTGLPTTTTTSAGAVYRSWSEVWNFPEPFAFKPKVFAGASRAWRWAAATATDNLTAEIRQYAYESNNTPIESTLFAIGRWKE